MRRRFVTFPLFLALVLSLTFHASAGEADGALVEIGNWIYNDTDASFSCDAKLSGAETKGYVFAVLYAESGKVKQIKKYAAEATTPIYLPGTDTTDYVRIIWTDERYTPIAGPEILRMRDNGRNAYRGFEERIKNLCDNDLTQSGDPMRLLVSCAESLRWEDYGVDYSVDEVIAGPNNFYIVQFNSFVKAKWCKEKLERLSSVRYVLLDSKIVAKADEIDSGKARLWSGEDTDNRHYSWGVEATEIGAYAEDLLKRGLDKEIIVAVVDSGVAREHPFLKDRLLPGYDFIEMDDVPQDEKIHGTHVAGIIADCTLDMNVKILPIRVLDKTGASLKSSVPLGIYYAIEHGADIINLSLAFLGNNDATDDAIAYAISKNITVVAAAGNYDRDALLCCPAHIRDCITVTGIEQKSGVLKRYGESNYGKAVDVSAPGGKIKSSVPKNENGIEYEFMSGTSMAAPHISAAAALLKCEYGKSYTPGEISDALKGAAKQLPEDTEDSQWILYQRDHLDASWSDFLGAGFLDMRPFFLKCTVTFQDNAAPPITVPYRTRVTLPSAASVKDGYDFMAWNTRADGGGKSYQAGETLTVTEDMTLYALWERIPDPESFYAMLYNDGELTFQRGNAANPEKNLIAGYPVPTTKSGYIAQRAAWYPHRDKIRVVSFADAIRPASTALWFHGCENLSEIRGLENLDVSLVKDMSQMFSGCDALTALDLSALDTRSADNLQQMFFECASLKTLDLTGWNTASVTSMADMFSGCSALETVCTSETFTTGAVLNSAGMFDGCAALIGGAGTKYDVAHTDKQYARIDTADAPGYFTAQSPAIIEIETVSGTPRGTVQVPVLITQNPGIAGAQMDILFDENLTLKNIIKGNVFSVGAFNPTVDKGRVQWYYDYANVTDTGVLFTLTFQISPDAEGGMYAVSVSPTGEKKANLSDYDFHPVSLEVKPGGVQVLESAPDSVYAVLYADGELAFQNSSQPRSDKAVTAIYNAAHTTADIPWKEQREKITAVTFADRIRPLSTSNWFEGCVNLTRIQGFERLDTSAVESMGAMFRNCRKLTQLDLSGLDTSRVTNMYDMFLGCSSLTSLDISGFDTSHVTSMSWTFYGCSSLTVIYATDTFRTEQVIHDGNLFAGCVSLVGEQGTIYDGTRIDKSYARIDDGTSAPGYFTDPASVQNIYAVLYTDGNLAFQNSNRIESGAMANAFYNVKKEGYSSENMPWKDQREQITSVTFADRIQPFSTAHWFDECANLTEVRNIENLNARRLTDMSAMFGACSSLKELDLSALDTSRVEKMEFTFAGCAALEKLNLSGWNTSRVTSMYGMFLRCFKITDLDLSAFDTSHVTHMGWMFSECHSLTRLNISSFDTSQVTTMQCMFQHCFKLPTADVSDFETHKVTDMGGMFYGCYALEKLDVSHFHTGIVRNMTSMFAYCQTLKELDVSGFDTAYVTSMGGMFSHCSAVKELNVGNFDTGLVQDMSNMFAYCKAIKELDLSGFDTGKVTSMENMFAYSAMSAIYASDSFATASDTESGGMFTGCTTLVGGRGTTYDSTHTDKEYARIDGGTFAPGYFTAK